MAWITRLEVKPGQGRIQPTQVVALVKVFETANNDQIIQIDTHGSEDRKNPRKQSQTFQLGEEAARQLYDLLRQTYNFN